MVIYRLNMLGDYEGEVPKPLRLEFLDERPELQKRVKEYMAWDRNPLTSDMIRQLINTKNVDALSKLLETRLTFGTAGLRGQMGPGFNAMNDLVIIQTTQGFLKYMETVFHQDDLQKRGIVVGYDARHNSGRFALLITNTFMRKGYQVHLYSDICPTPFVPFAVQLYECCAGIMITASHNPKDDNGYKVYWQNGAQIISPHDKGIQNAILENLAPWKNAWTLDPVHEAKLINPMPEVVRRYYKTVCHQGLGYDRERNARTKLKFTYTPMHGVGFEFMELAFKMSGFDDFISVKEQKNPDPEFPTVKFPNPEEGKSALNLAIKTANDNDSTVILANDPDADRLAVAEKLPNGEWKIFNGNEIGALLGWWCFQNWIDKNGRKDLKNCYMIASTVSSKILRSIAEVEGFNFEETLTGFKWMANLAVKLAAKNKKVLFAFEEAIGFMWETVVLDKDGISAGVRVAEMATALMEQDLTMNEQLVKIYETYGYHISRNSYYLCYDPDTINEMFANIRNLNNKSYPIHLLDGKYKISRVRDLTTGYDSGESDERAKLPASKGSQMLTFSFENGLVVTLRTSGTEPKIKYYTELCASAAERDWDAVRATLDEMVGAIINEWVLPERWGLAVPADSETDAEERDA